MDNEQRLQINLFVLARFYYSCEARESLSWAIFELSNLPPRGSGSLSRKDLPMTTSELATVEPART